MNPKRPTCSPDLILAAVAAAEDAAAGERKSGRGVAEAVGRQVVTGSPGESSLPVILLPSIPQVLAGSASPPAPVFPPLPDAILERKKVWSMAALKPHSPLVGVASASRLVAGDCVLLAGGMCRVLLASHERRCVQMGGREGGSF